MNFLADVAYVPTKHKYAFNCRKSDVSLTQKFSYDIGQLLGKYFFVVAITGSNSLIFSILDKLIFFVAMGPVMRM